MSYEKDKQYLSHHGIVGMHWGQRNGPPYPLGYNAHSASEKKAGWQKSLKGDGRDSRRYGATSKNAAPSIKKKTLTEDELEKMRQSARDSNKSDKSKAVDADLRAAIGVATLNPIMASRALVELGQAAVASSKEKKNNARIDALEVDKKTGFHIKARDFTPEEDLKCVNPGFKDFDKNTKNNCMLCTTAYELRRRGYDVVANKATMGYTPNEVKKWFPKAEVETIYRPKDKKELFLNGSKASLGLNTKLTKTVIESLSKQEDGARGNLMVTFGDATGPIGGHSVFYEVKNGKVIIRDAQANKTYTNPGKLIGYCIDAQYIRLDNLEFDKEKIKEAVR